MSQCVEPKPTVEDSDDYILPSPQTQVFPSSVIEGEFEFYKCTDVHLGPKYEHNGDVVINHIHNVAVSCEDLSVDLKKALKEELDHLNKNTKINKYSIKSSCLQIWPIYTAIFSLFMLVTVVLITGMFASNTKITSEPKVTKNNVNVRTSDEQSEKDYPLSLQFVLRESWGAAQPLDELKNNSFPVRRVIFMHTVSSGTCNRFTACKQQVQSIQEWHMSSNVNLDDIGYNFVIGSDGYIYVGVGWYKVGAHSKGYNTDSLGVAFVGDFRRDIPNDLMLSSAKRLLEFGEKTGKLSEDYQLYGHCQILSYFPYSPGKNILKEIKTWNHWNSTNIDRCPL